MNHGPDQVNKSPGMAAGINFSASLAVPDDMTLVRLQSWTDCNLVAPLTSLKNRYFAVRHGRSEAGDLGIIISRPENGISGYGLTENGRRQAYDLFREAYANGQLDAGTRFISSPFLRARQTADIGVEIIRPSAALMIAEALRERGLGDCEGKCFDAFKEQWEAFDRDNPLQAPLNGESLGSLLLRTTALICELERDYQDQTFVLVSLADPIRALRLGFARQATTSPLRAERILNATFYPLILS